MLSLVSIPYMRFFFSAFFRFRGCSLCKYRRTPSTICLKYAVQSSMRTSNPKVALSDLHIESASAKVFGLWYLHSLKMNGFSSSSEFQMFVCIRTRIGRPPDILVTVSSRQAGMKWKKMAASFQMKIDGTNLRWAYHTADWRGVSFKNTFTLPFSVCQRNGLQVEVVQWKMFSSWLLYNDR